MISKLSISSIFDRFSDFFNNPSPNIATKEIFSLQKYIFMEALNKLVCNVEASLRLIFYHDQTWIESEQS